MTISYNWLSEYLPEIIEPEKLSKILTSIGLEVESLEKYESIKGGLNGLIIGEILECNKHPNADKLSVTKVNIGAAENLQIVCGASNVATGQKVIVATVGTTIYPINGASITMRVAKIRSIESHGMICSEDEIGLGNNHDGIIVLPNDVIIGSNVSDYFTSYSDWIFEIGLTPNRMDAMSHLGVAKDVCAYLSHHSNSISKVVLPFKNDLKIHQTKKSTKINVENTEACLRYAGVNITGIKVGDSPDWLKNKLNAIGVRTINNIVDITNYILHETGQPLHAFDANKIEGEEIIITCLAEGKLFITLDEKERKLSSTDLMICDGNKNPLCIAGIFGGLNSGVSESTVNIFLESACFNSVSIRKSSLFHNLRTDAATRFEKGVDISNTVNVLKRAATLIIEIAGGEISSEFIDIFPAPKEKNQVTLNYQYLKKLSGKIYHPDAVKKILQALGFEIIREGIEELSIAVPFSKPDTNITADIVEEILRIDGIDNIEIPTTITISPSINANTLRENLREKIANYLVGQGFNEILTNSITNSKYYSEQILNSSVKMLNSLSADLDIMRPSMLESGLETIAFNINRKNNNLLLFEFGKSYTQKKQGKYLETEQIVLYFTGLTQDESWKEKSKQNDFFKAKGMATSILKLIGFNDINFRKNDNSEYEIFDNQNLLGIVSEINKSVLNKFDIKQTVFYINFLFVPILELLENKKIVYKEVSKFPSVQRDLAIVVEKNVQYFQIESIVKKLNIYTLNNTRLFDVFESDKLGVGKKSLAINFTFIDEEKTLTDVEIDVNMNKLIKNFELELNAEIRK